MRLTTRVPVAIAACVLIACVTASVVVAAHPGRSHSAATVKATLSEMQISATPTSVPAGNVKFVVHNVGTVEHELIVVPWPKSGKLSISHFRVDEHTSVGEVSELAPGKTGQVTLSLAAGRYLLLCNVPGHYELGMRAALRVVPSK